MNPPPNPQIIIFMRFDDIHVSELLCNTFSVISLIRIFHYPNKNFVLAQSGLDK